MWCQYKMSSIDWPRVKDPSTFMAKLGQLKVRIQSSLKFLKWEREWRLRRGKEREAKRKDKIKVHFNRWSINNNNFIARKILPLIWSLKLFLKSFFVVIILPEQDKIEINEKILHSLWCKAARKNPLKEEIGTTVCKTDFSRWIMNFV